MTTEGEAKRFPGQIHPDLQQYAVRVDDIHLYPGNPKEHDIPTIRESLRTNGQYRSIVVQTKTGHVLAGNGTLEAAQEEGWKEIAAEFIDVDEETAKRIVAVDNESSRKRGVDAHKLVALLDGLETLEGTGYDTKQLDDLIASMEAAPKEIDYEPFRGSWAETPEETERRAANAPPGVEPIRQVILAFRQPEMQSDFLNRVQYLRKLWKIDGITETVHEAVRRTYGVEKDAEDEGVFK